MFDHIGLLSTLPPKGTIPKVQIIDYLKTLCHRVKRSLHVYELEEVISDVKLLESNCDDLRTRLQLRGSSNTMRQLLDDYDSPMMQDFAKILASSDGHCLRMVLLVSLTNLGSSLILAGEVVDPDVPRVDPIDHLPASFDINLEMRLQLPDKDVVYEKMNSLAGKQRDSAWKLFQCELHFRRDSINPIRNLNIDTNVAPCVRWDLSPNEVDEDLHYLYNWVYKTSDWNLLQGRWEWGRKLWTLHARAKLPAEQDYHVIVKKGRKMEMTARSMFESLDLLV